MVLAGFLAGDPTITLASVTALSVGIAIQNVPEGAIVSLPLATNGLSRPRAFLAGTLCGAVEPAGAAIMVAITGLVTPLLPVVLAFAAGAMMYVVTEELIPQTQQGRHTNIGHHRRRLRLRPHDGAGRGAGVGEVADASNRRRRRRGWRVR